jgi:hypothetical protein
MKTTEMASTLEAFAALASVDRASDLRKLAGIFNKGIEETVAARVKRISRALNARPECRNYPMTLKESLTTIASGFAASNAKQASDFEAIKSLFEGSKGGVSVDEFVSRINEALAAMPQAAGIMQARPADQRLVSRFAEELARAAFDPNSFSKVVDRLRDDTVSTPTLAAIANRFVGNDKRYKGRKPAIDDILRRQRQDARARARDRATIPPP